MSERADPDDSSFKGKFSFRMRRGFIPWISYKPNPYREAVIWRYSWISDAANGKKVLDVPCGMGWGTSLIRSASEVHGIDISEEAIRKAQAKYGSKIRFSVGSMNNLDFPESSFDIIACLEGIEHVSEKISDEFFIQAKKVLTRSGRLFLSSPYTKNGKHSGNPYHVKEYQPEEIEKKFGLLFSIVHVTTRQVDQMLVNYYVLSPK